MTWDEQEPPELEAAWQKVVGALEVWVKDAAHARFAEAWGGEYDAEDESDRVALQQLVDDERAALTKGVAE